MNKKDEMLKANKELSKNRKDSNDINKELNNTNKTLIEKLDKAYLDKQVFLFPSLNCYNFFFYEADTITLPLLLTTVPVMKL